MGFDVLYLPPIHPIGTTARKGPNNTLTAADDDPGSPWAIGSRRAGTPLSTRSSAPSRTFPIWWPRYGPTAWSWRSTTPCSARPTTPGSASIPNGSITGPTARIAYAENPPKVYQDIVPINFWPAAGG